MMRVKPAAATTSGVEAVDPRGIVSITGGDWTVEHPVPICKLESGTEWPSFTRPLEAANKSWRENMKKLLTSGAAAIACAAFFDSSAPAMAGPHEYCRRDVTEYGALSCSFDTLAQCQATSSGRGGDCLRDPSLGAGASAYAYAPNVRGTYAYAPIARKHHQK
jgi:Protein of unknown function (DUF3551)